jgi:hypothetical protein
MNHQRKFRPTMDGLEQRLALSGSLGHAVGVAGVVDRIAAIGSQVHTATSDAHHSGNGSKTGSSHHTGRGHTTGSGHHTGTGHTTGTGHHTGTGHTTGTGHHTGTGHNTGTGHSHK